MAWTRGPETLRMAIFGHFFKNRRFGLHFAGRGAGYTGVKTSKKKIFRGKPPVMSGEVYRCPTDSLELCGGLEKKSTKNQNIREGAGRLGGRSGDIGGTLAPYTEAITKR